MATVDMTDKEIAALATDEWLQILCGLWEAIGKPVDEKRLIIYAKVFGEVPAGLLEKAVTRLLRDGSNYQVVATAPAIWAAIRKELGDPFDIEQAISNWQETQWNKMFVHFPGPQDGNVTAP